MKLLIGSLCWALRYLVGHAKLLILALEVAKPCRRPLVQISRFSENYVHNHNSLKSNSLLFVWRGRLVFAGRVATKEVSVARLAELLMRCCGLRLVLEAMEAGARVLRSLACCRQPGKWKNTWARFYLEVYVCTTTILWDIFCRHLVCGIMS